jgi:hypothetical protein
VYVELTKLELRLPVFRPSCRLEIASDFDRSRDRSAPVEERAQIEGKSLKDSSSPGRTAATASSVMSSMSGRGRDP